jgi:hypothetical protein
VRGAIEGARAPARARCDDGRPRSDEPWEDRRIERDDSQQRAVDADEVGPGGRAAEEPAGDAGGFERWRRESALGAVGTGVARGLQAVFAPPVDEPVIVASVPGEPPDADTRVRVVLDPNDPAKSIAIVPGSPPAPPPG